MMSWQKLGIFGGAFNPVHWGHLLIAETAFSQSELDQVLWIPTHFPSHKKNIELLDFHHRLTMVQSAIADHPHFTVPDLPLEGKDSSYAVSTLLKLRMMYSSVEWYWIIGVDSFQNLPQWRCSAQVAAECTWLVAGRDQMDLIEVCDRVATQFAVHSVQLRWQALSMPQVQVSSTLIRHYCQIGRSLRYLVPDPVRDYIATHRLYHAQL